MWWWLLIAPAILLGGAGPHARWAVLADGIIILAVIAYRRWKRAKKERA
jgi:hypothetical protein